MLIVESEGLSILNSTFKNNFVSSSYIRTPDLTLSSMRQGAGLTISYINHEGSGYALIQGCRFENNRASVNDGDLDDVLERPKLYVPRGHGGGLLLSFQNTVRHRVDVSNCSFSNNFAKFAGGAISVQFYRGSVNATSPSSSRNTVVINGVVFLDNTCAGAGGAVSVNAYEAANHNRVNVSRSLFHGNSAETEGGGCSFIIEVTIKL